MTALVFNCHYNGLSIIRELGRRGVRVFALDSVRSVGTFSRYSRFIRVPDPSTDECAFIDALMRIGEDLNEKAVLFPTNDHWAVAISRHKARLSSWYTPCVADYEAVQLVIEKQKFYEWALLREMPVPRSWRISSANGIPEDRFPIAAKPEYRRVASNDHAVAERGRLFDGMRLTVLRNGTELKKFCRAYTDLLPYLLFQEYVEGLSDCMYTIGVYADRDHNVRALFSGRKVRGYPPDVGDCMVGQVEAVPEELKELVRSICREIKYHGIAEFEFKRDARSGNYMLIEVNPRSWSWVGITQACGVSLPWIAYRDLTGIGGDVGYTESDLPDGSVKFVRLLDDIANCLYRNRRAGYPEWHFTFKGWWRSLRAQKLVMAEFAADDWKPGFRSLKSMVGSVVHKLLRRSSPGKPKADMVEGPVRPGIPTPESRP